MVMASLAGVPPFLGFWSKLVVIQAALDAGMAWLAILAVICAVLGAFYYLRVIRAMFFEEADGDGAVIHPDSHVRAAFALNALALLGLGIFAQPLMAWCQQAFPA
jgi:NADH-quinone oxidoreductase subunit N